MPHTNFAVRAAAWRKKNEEKGHIRSVSQYLQGNAAFSEGRASGKFRGSGLLTADAVAREARATAPSSGARFFWGKTPTSSYTTELEPESDDPFFLPVRTDKIPSTSKPPAEEPVERFKREKGEKKPPGGREGAAAEQSERKDRERGSVKRDRESPADPAGTSKQAPTGKKTSAKGTSKAKAKKQKKSSAASGGNVKQALLEKLHSDPFLELPAEQQSVLEKRNDRKFKAIKFFEKVRVERLIKRLQTEQTGEHSLETLKDMHNYIVHYPRAMPYYSVFKKPASDAIEKVRELIMQTLKEKVVEGELEDATEIFLRSKTVDQEATEDASSSDEASSNDRDEDEDEEEEEVQPKTLKKQNKRQRR